MLVGAVILSFVLVSAGNFVSELNHHYKFDHNILLFHGANRISTEEFYDPNTLRTIVQLNGTNSNRIPYQHIALAGGNLCLLLVFTHDISTIDVLSSFHTAELADTEKLSYWNVKMKVAIIILRTTEIKDEQRSEHLKKLFDWSWSKSIVDLAVVYGTEPHLVYTYNRFQSNEIVQVERSAWAMYFPDKGTGLHGHKLHVSVYRGQPDIQYKNGRFQSMDGKMCEYILDGLNAAYRVTVRQNISWDIQKTVIVNGSAQFAPHLFVLRNISLPQDQIFTYPVIMDSVILLAPAARPIDQFQSFLRQFTNKMSVILIVVPIGVLIVLFWIFRRFKDGLSNFVQDAAFVISLLFALNMAGRKHSTDSSDQLFTLSLSFGGLLFTNQILSVFISLLTQPVMQAEINTFHQLDQTDLKIVVSSSAVPAFLEWASDKGYNWKNRMDPALQNASSTSLMYSYNNRYAYFTTRSRTVILSQRQRHLSLQRFHIVDEYFIQTLSAYYVGSRAPFKDRVDQLILQAFCAGLYDKWRRDTYPSLVKDGYFKQNGMTEDDPEEPFNILVAIVYGWIVSVVLFV